MRLRRAHIIIIVIVAAVGMVAIVLYSLLSLHKWKEKNAFFQMYGGIYPNCFIIFLRI